MSVLPSDIVVYGSANMPEADGTTIGGAVDFTRRVAFYDVTPAGSVDVISSSSADTATKIVTRFDRCDPKPDIDLERAELGDRFTIARAVALRRIVRGER